MSFSEGSKVVNLRLKGDTIKTMTGKLKLNKCAYKRLKIQKNMPKERPLKITDREIKRLAVSKSISPS